MAPAITIERFVKELEKLHEGITAGGYKPGEYDQRLARTLQELRERGIEGDRKDVIAALDSAHERGVITDSVKDHLEKRLGVV